LKKLLAPSWTPHDYQKKARKFLLDNGTAIALLDPGLGKTSITLSAFAKLHKERTAPLLFVIAPLRVCHEVWPAEVAKWADFHHLNVGVMHGKQKNTVFDNIDDYDIVTINPEGLDWLFLQHTPAQLARALSGAILVIDELTRFKKSTGKRFKLLKRFLGLFSRRWGLTGTPASNGLMDLFGQVYIIDEGKTFGRYITHFRRQYFTPLDPNGWRWAPQPGAEQRIYEALAPLAIRMSAEDYLQLPELIDVRHTIELPPAVRKVYDALEDDLYSKFGDGEIVAGNAAAASTKCRQVCNGAVYVDDDVFSLVKGKKRSVLELHNLKIDAVAELLEDLQGQPLLLAYEFNHDLERLQRAFDAPHIGKGSSDKQVAQYIRDWNANKLPLLLAHPASAGHGLNLQEGQAQHTGFFGVPWDYELYLQFLYRVRRQGNKQKRVFNHLFVAKDTVDMVALYDKARKGKNQNKLFDALKELRDARRK
jgi:SNF2 family DNA or RNA helicase